MANISYNVTLTPANVTSFGLSSVTPTLPKVFPNGNSNVTTSVARYVDRYNSFLCKSADAFIGLGETLVEAKESLNKEEFKAFLEQTGLNNSKATYSKLKKIGENAPRLRPYVNNLPQNWTTIYALSKLEADQFERVIQKLNAYSTAKDVAFLTEDKVETTSSFAVKVMISFAGLDIKTKNRIFCALAELQGEYNFQLKLSSNFDDELFEDEMKNVA